MKRIEGLILRLLPIVALLYIFLSSNISVANNFFLQVNHNTDSPSVGDKLDENKATVFDFYHPEITSSKKSWNNKTVIFSYSELEEYVGFVSNLESVDSWKIMIKNPIIRAKDGNVEKLHNAMKMLEDAGDTEGVTKLKSLIQRSNSKQNLLNGISANEITDAVKLRKYIDDIDKVDIDFKMKDFEIISNGNTLKSVNNVATDDLSSGMSQLITDRNNLRAQLADYDIGSTEYNKLIGDIGKKSEEIGELAGKNFLSKYFSEYTVVNVKMTGNGTGEFDIIAKHKTKNLYILVECKGGNAALGIKTLSSNKVAMQGSRPYVDDITLGMKNWEGPPTNPDPTITYSDPAFVNDLGFDLEAALFDNKVEHFLVHQKLDVAGNTKITEISKFDLD